MKRLSRLSLLLKTRHYRRHRPMLDDGARSTDATNSTTVVVDTSPAGDAETVLRRRRARPPIVDAQHAASVDVAFERDGAPAETTSDVMTAAEQTQLTAENEKMFDRLNTMVDEIE